MHLFGCIASQEISSPDKVFMTLLFGFRVNGRRYWIGEFESSLEAYNSLF